MPLYTELLLCVYLFLAGGGLYYLVTPGVVGQETCTGVTCTARGLRLRSLGPQTLYVQGRWSLSLPWARLCLTHAGVRDPWSVVQVGAYFPGYPFGCLMVAGDGGVCSLPTGRLCLPGNTPGIRLFYNINPFLLPFLTPHLLVRVEPGCIRETR